MTRLFGREVATAVPAVHLGERDRAGAVVVEGVEELVDHLPWPVEAQTDDHRAAELRSGQHVVPARVELGEQVGESQTMLAEQGAQGCAHAWRVMGAEAPAARVEVEVCAHVRVDSFDELAHRAGRALAGRDSRTNCT